MGGLTIAAGRDSGHEQERRAPAAEPDEADWTVSSLHPGTTAIGVRLEHPEQPAMLAKLAAPDAPPRLAETEGRVLECFAADGLWPGATLLGRAGSDLLLAFAGGESPAPGSALDRDELSRILAAHARLATSSLADGWCRLRGELPTWGAGRRDAADPHARRCRLFRRRRVLFLRRASSVLSAAAVPNWEQRVAELDSSAEACCRAFSAIAHGPRAGLVHGDLHAANVVLGHAVGDAAGDAAGDGAGDANVGDGVTILDWSRAGSGPPRLDVLRLLTESSELDAQACEALAAEWSAARIAASSMDPPEAGSMKPPAGDNSWVCDDAEAARSLAEHGVLARHLLMSVVIGFGANRPLATWEHANLRRSLRADGPLDF